MLRWRVAARTNPGCQRQQNEDAYYVSADSRVFAVADGMGGALGGARASTLAVEAIDTCWRETPPPSGDRAGVQQWLQATITFANQRVWRAAEADRSVRGMGTTVVVAVRDEDPAMAIAHVGDSRAYLLREGTPTLLTNDHSVVQEMVRAGRMTQEEARINPYKNLITRCLGHDEHVEIDHTTVELQPRDWIVLCSDGLPTVLRDEQISDVVSDAQDPDGVCEALLQQTLDGGAPDNVTIVALVYLDESPDNEPV
jgi:protein phosphatase